LFAISPAPSGQHVVAAGLVHVPLVPLTGAFFAGRVVSYSAYVTAASLAEQNLGDVVLESLRSPWAIATQVVLLGIVTLLPLVDWHRYSQSRRRKIV
jgi:hypothetical protein